jgi:endonuclease III
MNKKELALDVASRFKKHYPDPKTELVYENEMQLVVAVMLSTQTTDIKVNEVTRHLFEKYSSWEGLAEAGVEELRENIHGVNFHKTKAERVKKAANRIIEVYSGKVPRTMKDLTSLPGIARKSANVIMQELWAIAEGIVVDTHVTRVSNRLGLVDTKNAKIIERELMELLPKEHWRNFSGATVLHGRYVCKARSPECADCFLKDICPSSEV